MEKEFMNNKWISKLNGNPIDWLLSSNSWTKHMTLIELLEKSNESNEVITAKNNLDQDPFIHQLLSETSQWFAVPPKRHDDSKMSHYQLKMLADFGFNDSNNKIKDITKLAMTHVENNHFAIKQALPQKGSNTKIDDNFDEWHALPCDSPVISSTLYRLGNRSDPLMKSIELIKEKWNTESGWFCHLFFVESQYKKHQIGCMMAGLQALELFSLFPANENDTHIQNAYNTLQYHKDFGKSLYYFGRSKKYWSFKYPYVWYNALYIAEILSRFDFFKEELLLKETINWILESQDENGLYRPTSMFMNYKDWDFANKKEPSPWITYLCCKILKQYYS
jgi:hypothetical protein